MDTIRLDLLVEARDKLVEQIRADQTEELCRKCGGSLTSPLPALVRELRATLIEIEKIPGSSEVTPLDHLADGIIGDLDERRRRRAASR
jgi:hypothetical protein